MKDTPSSLRKNINRVRKQIYNKTINYKFVRNCLYALVPGYLGLLLLGVIIAYIFGGTIANPGEYSILDNYISDLAGVAFTPAPYLYDIAAILCGVLTLPSWFYLEKLLVPLPQKPEEYNKITRLHYRLGSYGLLFSIIGSIGYVGIGIFSIDRDLWGVMHLFTGAMAFGGFLGGAMAFGLIIFLYETKIPKIIGIYGMIGPISFAALAGIIFVVSPELITLYEWFLLFSIIIWISSLTLIISFKKELHI
jgi:hypothetical protein